MITFIQEIFNGGLPFQIIDAMVQCFGKSFYYKDTMETFLVAAGIDRSLANKYRDDYKFVWAKKLLADLSGTPEGELSQRRILTEFCNLKNLPDGDVKDKNAGLDALRKLKSLALENDLIIKKERNESERKARQAAQKIDLIKERASKLEKLKTQFTNGFATQDRQKVGYELEDIIYELFGLFEIEFRKPYKLKTQQIDGHFFFDGFDYLIEARWRKDFPTEPQIGGFKIKVDGKIESTRGLFISVLGFRDEVIKKFEDRGSNIIFMDGEDLIYILEGRVDLRDALKFKISKAAQEGKVFVHLREKF